MNELLPVVVTIVLLLCPFIVLYQYFKNRKASKQFEKIKAEKLLIEEKAEPLWKYQVIKNVDDEIDRKRFEAERDSKKLFEDARTEADTVLTEAKAEAKNIAEKAIKKSEKAQELYDTTIEETKRMIQNAKDKAESIAGDALKAMDNAELYKKAATAMQNKIKGYGDEYIVPNRSVLDELAEEFSHKDAGVELKNVRQRIKKMITNGIAADCDYVEINRKTTAIRFVLDAFNGKVDSILSKAKHNNYGKLEQEIIDSYNLVNHNGQAFRDAKILSEYRDERLSELKWAVATNELKLQEREEQRRIKEAMREEEKARREYEKAIKQAEKEEKMLQDAMVTARKHLAEANDDQRQKYEQQLQELQEKLEDAEAKNQRALSMAQQTRQGHVYVISNVGSFGEDIYKIGLTRRLEPMDRVKELGDASVPFGFDVHAMIHSEDAPALENELHRVFSADQVNKVNSRKEFFQVGIKQIRSVIEERGLDAHWTMTAEAQEYRESLTLAAAMKNVNEEGVVENEYALVN